MNDKWWRDGVGDEILGPASQNLDAAQRPWPPPQWLPLRRLKREYGGGAAGAPCSGVYLGEEKKEKGHYLPCVVERLGVDKSRSTCENIGNVQD